MSLDAEPGGDADVEVKRDRLRDRACPLVAGSMLVDERVRRSGPLDCEAARACVAAVVRRRESEVVEDASEVEQLLVVSDLVTLGEQRRESPRAKTMGVEPYARELACSL